MRRYATLYGHFLAQQFKGMLEFQASFYIGVVATVLHQAAILLTIWVVMRQVPSMNGWTLPQVMLIYGLLTLSRSLNHMFADNTFAMGGVIRSGGFDRLLVRPIDPLFHLLASSFSVEGLGNFLVGVTLVAGAGRELGIFAAPLNVLYVVVAVVSGAGIYTALNLITSTSAFWVVESLAVSLSVFENHRFAFYPLTIYPRAIRFALTWIIPYGFAAFYPASFLLGREVGVLAWLGPVIAAVLLIVAYRVWSFGLRHYTGTGT